jgi:hypothetical protein
MQQFPVLNKMLNLMRKDESEKTEKINAIQKAQRRKKNQIAMGNSIIIDFQTLKHFIFPLGFCLKISVRVSFFIFAFSLQHFNYFAIKNDFLFF